MKPMHIAIIFLAVFLGVSLHNSYAFSNGQSASLVIGQPNFTSTGIQKYLTISNYSKGLFQPGAVAFDPQGNLWVSDSFTFIKEFPHPFTTFERPLLVMRPPDLHLYPRQVLNAPAAMAFGPQGDLWMTGPGYSSVVKFKPPITPDSKPSLVIPTPDLGYDPRMGMAFDPAGNLWVADTGNDRILEYPVPLTAKTKPVEVIGPYNHIGNNILILLEPRSIAFDRDGNLWVADTGNSRIMEFAAPVRQDEPPSVLLGAKDPYSSSHTVFRLGTGDITVWDTPSNYNGTIRSTAQIGGIPQLCTSCFWPSYNGSISSTSIGGTSSLAFDPEGNLWAAGGDRVLEFASPFSTNMPASVVIGHKEFDSSITVRNGRVFPVPVTAENMLFPDSITFDPAGNLWVSDSRYNRVLEFDSGLAVPEFPLAIPVLLAGMATLVVFYRARVIK